MMVPFPLHTIVGQFGDKFRKAREKKELSLDDVSNVTKIAARMLQAIEEEHFDLLPGGVFNKGFIRAYAKHLGLNDEEAVTDYLACLREAQIGANEIWQAQSPAPARNSAAGPNPRPVPPSKAKPAAAAPAQVEELPELQLPRAEHIRGGKKEFIDHDAPRLPWKIPALALALILVAGVFWIRHSRTTSAASASTTPPRIAPASSGSPQNAADQSSPSQLPPDALQGNTPQPHPASAPASPAPVNLPAAQLASPPPAQATPTEQAPASHPAAAPATPSAAQPDANGDVSVRNFQKPAAAPADKPVPATLNLVIRATETSWISVQADGQTVSQETLIAPAHATIRANREIVARIGNAAGVTFLWNGQEVPADGAEAEVKTFVFDSTGMRVVPSAPPASNQ